MATLPKGPAATARGPALERGAAGRPPTAPTCIPVLNPDLAPVPGQTPWRPRPRPTVSPHSAARRADGTARYIPYSRYSNRPAWASSRSPTKASGSKPVALRHTSHAAGNARIGGDLTSCSTHGIHARCAEFQRGQSHRMCDFISGAPRQKGHLSDRRMACPAALPAVHVAPASSPRRMLCSPSHLQALPARLSVQGSAQPSEGTRPTPLRLPERPIPLALVHVVAQIPCVRLHHPPASGALASAVPAHPSATSLRVVVSPVGGRPTGPCPWAPWRASGPDTRAQLAPGSAWCLACMPGRAARVGVGIARATGARHRSLWPGGPRGPRWPVSTAWSPRLPWPPRCLLPTGCAPRRPPAPLHTVPWSWLGCPVLPPA